MDIINDYKRGNERSDVVLIEYGDYECPNCGEAYGIIQKLLSTIRNNFCFIFRNFPLSQIHPHALHAAYAAEAAGRQDKFWDMHDMLFENQSNLRDEDLLMYADTLNINNAKFRSDFHSENIAAKVKSDFMEGIKNDVNGTPTFFINGDRFDEEDTYEALLQAIERRVKDHEHG